MHRNQLRIIALLLGFLVAAGIWYFRRPEPPREQIFCTQDALQCPDGSYVGRTGPNCEFAACPAGEGPPGSEE